MSQRNWGCSGSPQRGGNYGGNYSAKSAVPERFSAALDTALYGQEPVGASEFSRGRGLVAPELADATPDEMLRSVGYFGPAKGAASAYAKLAAGLDETIVRIITARPGPEPVVQTMEALTPALIRAN